jgi:hypothetical protein
MSRKFVWLWILPLSLFGGDWYSEYWQRLYLTTWKNGPYSLRSYVRLETRNHMKSIRGVLLSEQFAWKLSDNWTFGLNYTYVHSRSVVENSTWRWQHRIEIEGNRAFAFPWCTELRTRNRLEIRRVQGNKDLSYEFRQRCLWFFPIEGQGRLKAFTFGNELFYSLNLGRLVQDRILPCQFTFELSSRSKIDVYGMIRLFLQGQSTWEKSAVLGTNLHF